MKFISLILGVIFMSHYTFAGKNIVFKGYAHFKIKPEYVKPFSEEVRKIIKPTLQEKGCLRYEAYQLVDDNGQLTNEFLFHEVWKSKSDMMIDHKEKAPHMIRFFSLIKIGTSDWVQSFEVSGHNVIQLDTSHKQVD